MIELISQLPFWGDDRKLSKFEAFLWLLMNAANEDKNVVVNNKIVPVKRGEICTTLRTLAGLWKWDKCTVKRFLDTDVIQMRYRGDTNMIHITLLKYDTYTGSRYRGDTDAIQMRYRGDTDTPSEAILSSFDGIKNHNIPLNVIYNIYKDLVEYINTQEYNILPTSKEKKINIQKEIPSSLLSDGSTKKNTPVKRFIKPTISEIRDYCAARRNNVNPETFFDFYEAKGWYVGKNAMKDWKAAVRTWERTPSHRVQPEPKRRFIDE